jgi:non-specific serine/threonine protein kinase
MGQTTSGNHTYDVFISYSHTDQAWVSNWLMPRLEASGVRVCVDFRDFEIGAPSLVNMERAVEQSRKTLLILTPDWVHSEWANFESLLIQTEDPIGLRRRMLPLMLEPCQPPKRVSIFTYADFTEADRWESQLKRIVDAVNDIASLPEQEVRPAQVTTRKPTEISTTNLPERLTSFVGRAREISEIKHGLASTRLFTLTGAPGTGKTRLALEVASTLLEEYKDGVWLAELTSIQDREAPDVVMQAVARVFGLRDEPDCSLTAALAAYLRPKRLLLLLDNCDRLVVQCASLVNDLLPACPNLRVLVTSREILKVQGELVLNVPPLSLPDSHPRRLPLQELAKYEAIRLLVERARFSQPNFALTAQNAAAVTQICRRLSGLPLAIELVAARVKVLSVEQIAARLEDQFWVLTGGARTALPNQQTLQVAVNWSYDLLNEAERIVFSRLAVFAGSFTLEAAEAIGAGGNVKTYEILDLLAHLVDKSLVTAEETTDAAMRYRLLEPLREYGHERLIASDEAATLQRTHAKYYLAFAEEAEPRLKGPDQMVWQERLEKEHDNLRAALLWAKATGDAESLLRLAGAMGRFWWLRGYLTEGRGWLDHAQSQRDGVSASAQAKVLYHLGRIAKQQGDLEKAKEVLREGLAQYRGLNDRSGAANVIYVLGLVALAQGNFQAARDYLQEGLLLQRELRDVKSVADVLQTLGGTALLQGDFAAAQVILGESLLVYKELRHKLGIANAQHDLGLVARYQGNYSEARVLLEESLAACRELGHRPGIARSLSNLGNIFLDQGNCEAAQGCFEESLAIAQELGIKEGSVSIIESFASLSLCQGQTRRAARLYGAAEMIRQSIGAPLDPAGRIFYDRDLNALHTQLEEAVFAAAWADGQAMTLGQAAEYASSP